MDSFSMRKKLQLPTISIQINEYVLFINNNIDLPLFGRCIEYILFSNDQK